MRQQAAFVAARDFAQRSAGGEPAVHIGRVRAGRIHRLDPGQGQGARLGLHGGQPVGPPGQVDQINPHGLA